MSKRLDLINLMSAPGSFTLVKPYGCEYGCKRVLTVEQLDALLMEPPYMSARTL